jgi:hypothetical protein
VKLYRLFGLLGMLAVLAAAATAQDEKKDDKKDEPKAKAAKPPLVPATFRAYLVTDQRYPAKVANPVKPDDRDPRDRTGKIHCLVCENGPNPVVAIFVRADPKADATAKLAELTNKVSGLITTYRGDKLAAFAMFLQLDGEYPNDEARDEKANDVRVLAGVAKAPNVPFGLAPTKSPALDAWGVGEKDEYTVVFYRGMREVKRWKFMEAPTGDQVKEIADAVEAELNK